MSTEQEPPDDHIYSWLSFNNDTFHFYLESIKFYEKLLDEDVEAINQDQDLAFLLGQRGKNDLEIQRELKRVHRARDFMQEEIKKGGADAWDYDVHMSHGLVRFLKSVGLLYLQHLRNRRDALASKPRISKHALTAVDQRMSYFEEKTKLGVFSKATIVPLLVDELASDEKPIEPQGGTEIRSTRPRPILIDSIEILDPELKSRCLDLYYLFQQDGQQERLDTVVTEATRILEDKLRSASGAPADCRGLELAKFAFGGKAPKLIVSEIEAEREAVHSLFRGTFGFIRNPIHHQLVQNLSPQRVLQIIGMVDYLIFLAQSANNVTTDEESGG